jgi:hypothetical protein
MALAAGLEGWVGAYSDSNFGFVVTDGYRVAAEVAGGASTIRFGADAVDHRWRDQPA